MKALSKRMWCLACLPVIGSCGDSSGPEGVPRIVGSYSAVWQVEARNSGMLSSCAGEMRISSQTGREASGTYERYASSEGCTAVKGLVTGEVHETFLTLEFARLDGSREDFGIRDTCTASISDDIPLIGSAAAESIVAQSTITAQCPNPVSLENTIVEVRFSASR